MTRCSLPPLNLNRIHFYDDRKFSISAVERFGSWLHPTWRSRYYGLTSSVKILENLIKEKNKCLESGNSNVTGIFIKISRSPFLCLIFGWMECHVHLHRLEPRCVISIGLRGRGVCIGDGWNEQQEAVRSGKVRSLSLSLIGCTMSCDYKRTQKLKCSFISWKIELLREDMFKAELIWFFV